MHPQLIVRVAIDSVEFLEGYYVAVNGRSGATGSIFDPMSIEYAIGASSPLQPGDTCWIRGGTYWASVAGFNTGANVPGKGIYMVGVKGTASNPIRFKAYPGEWVKIKGGVEIWENVGHDAGYVEFWDMEFHPLCTTRSYPDKPTWIADQPALFGGDASGCKIINCYLHDGGEVWPMPIYNAGWEVHGCLIGWVGAYTVDLARNRDYCIYTHNDAGGDMLIQKNAFVCPFGAWGVNCYSTGGANVLDYYVEDNAFFDAGILVGVDNVAKSNQRNHIHRDYLYNMLNNQALQGGHPLRLGTADHANNLDIEVLDCYQVSNYTLGTVHQYYARSITQRGNTFIRLTHADNNQIVLRYTNAAGWLACDVDYNTYHWGGNAGSPFYDVATAQYRTFPQWKTLTGWDTNSSFTTSMPATNVVKVIDNDYEVGRGFVVIYNWELLSSVDVDLSSLGIPNGEHRRLRNALNYEEYLDFSYNADDPYLSIPMSAATWTLKDADAYDSPDPWSSNPQPSFGIFLVCKR